ncbi:hypothetical protein LTR66_005157 [Elasticomyces elasticus]|nr:hypothetical protein LTR66_005157 [Elasticomyces elasticus]
MKKPALAKAVVLMREEGYDMAGPRSDFVHNAAKETVEQVQSFNRIVQLPSGHLPLDIQQLVDLTSLPRKMERSAWYRLMDELSGSLKEANVDTSLDRSKQPVFEAMSSASTKPAVSAAVGTRIDQGASPAVRVAPVIGTPAEASGASARHLGAFRAFPLIQ